MKEKKKQVQIVLKIFSDPSEEKNKKITKKNII